jgi:hypothetical protein
MELKAILAASFWFFTASMPSCQSCTEEATAAVNVKVVDEATRQPICDATVTVTEGSYSETLSASLCGYSGAWERAGTYRITIFHPDYLPRTIDGVRVTKDDCDHVIGQVLTVELTAGKPECYPGDSGTCTCPSGAIGTISCGPDGKLTPCQGC